MAWATERRAMTFFIAPVLRSASIQRSRHAPVASAATLAVRKVMRR